MTDLQKACLTVIRIEGPIHYPAVALKLGRGSNGVRAAMKTLYDAGFIEGCSQGWDVTASGRRRFSQMHAKRPSRSELVEKLKARGDWKGAMG